MVLLDLGDSLHLLLTVEPLQVLHLFSDSHVFFLLLKSLLDLLLAESSLFKHLTLSLLFDRFHVAANIISIDVFLNLLSVSLPSLLLVYQVKLAFPVFGDFLAP